MPKTIPLGIQPTVTTLEEGPTTNSPFPLTGLVWTHHVGTFGLGLRAMEEPQASQDLWTWFLQADTNGL